jgi:regulator of protease activity HflC (stomatin/prohibitin superfamily)
MESITSLFCVLGMILLVGAFFAASAIKIVPEYRRLVTFRLGRLIGTVGPGVVFLLPMIDRGMSVDLRERKISEKGIDALSQDNARLEVDLSYTYKVMDPQKAVLSVTDLDGSLKNKAREAIRTAMGRVPYSDLVFRRGDLRAEVYQLLVSAAQEWGAEVSTLELEDLRRARSA